MNGPDLGDNVFVGSARPLSHVNLEQTRIGSDIEEVALEVFCDDGGGLQRPSRW